MDLMNKGVLVVVSAPAGCGKDTVLENLKTRDLPLNKTISVTTRAMRVGEKDGVDYYFTDKESFRKKIENGEFFEYTEYNGNYYGTLKSEIERCVSGGGYTILKIEVEGGENIRRLVPDAVSLFIVPPSMEELEKRLRGRGTETEENLQIRLKTAKTEIKKAADYDYIVVNDTVDACTDRICDILKSEAMRYSRMAEVVKNLLS